MLELKQEENLLDKSADDAEIQRPRSALEVSGPNKKSLKDKFAELSQKSAEPTKPRELGLNAKVGLFENQVNL